MSTPQEAIDAIAKPMQRSRTIWAWSVDEEREEVVLFIPLDTDKGRYPEAIAGYRVELVAVPRAVSY